MGDILIRNIPDSLKREIAQAAELRSQSLSEKAIDLLRKGLVAERETKLPPGQSAWEMIRSIFDQDGPPTGEFSAIMDEIEAERKQEFGRPMEFGDETDDRP